MTLFQINPEKGARWSIKIPKMHKETKESIFGHYFAGEDKKPVAGIVDVFNIADSANEIIDNSYDISEIPDWAKYMGFFVVPGGASMNEDRIIDDILTFKLEGDLSWSAILNDSPLAAGASVFFSDTTQNFDDKIHFLIQGDKIYYSDERANAAEASKNMLLGEEFRIFLEEKAQESSKNPKDFEMAIDINSVPEVGENILPEQDEELTQIIKSDDDWVKLLSLVKNSK